MQAAAVLLVAREQHADRPRDRPAPPAPRGWRRSPPWCRRCRGRAADRPAAPAGGAATCSRCWRAPYRRARSAAARGRLSAEARVDVGVIADGDLVDRCARPARAARAASRCTSGRSSPSGFWVSNETSSASRSTSERHRRGYTMSDGPCRPPPPSSRCVARPGARRCAAGRPLPPRPHISAVAHAARRPTIDGHLDDPVWRDRAPVRRVRPALSRRGRAAQRAHRGARPLRRQERLRRHRLRAGPRADRAAPAAARRRSSPPTASGSTSTAARPASAPSTSRSTPRACCPTASTSTTPNYSSDWDAVWEAKVADHRPRLHASSSASRSRCCASRRCRCRTGASRCGASSTPGRRPTTGRSTRAAPPTYVPLFGRLDDCVGLQPPPARSSCARSSSGSSSTATADDAAPRWRTAGRRTASAGLDAKAHLTNELTLDLTVEPRLRPGRGRHGHPEPVDVRDLLPREAAVLPGGDRRLRDGRGPLVYTRRIGQQPAPPSADATRNAGRAARARPRSTARPSWSARSAARTTVGVMSAHDRRQRRRGADSRRRPRRSGGWNRWTAFNVLRLKRKLGGQRRGRRAGDGGQPLRDPDCRSAPLPGDAACRRPTGAAPTTRTSSARRALAFGHRATTRRAWQAIGVDYRRTGPPRSQPDGMPISPGPGRAGRASLYVGKEGGAHWLWSVWQHLTGQQLEFNDLGYLERKNDYQALLRRSPTGRWSRGGGRARRDRAAGQRARDLDGLTLWNEVELSPARRSPTSGRSTSTSTCAARYFDDREMGDGTALERAATAAVRRPPRLDPRRPLTGSLTATLDARQGGGIIFGASGDVSLRALSRLELALAADGRLRQRLAPLRRQRRVAGADRPPATYQFGDAERGQRGRDAARGLHIHARAVAAVLHAALSRTRSLRPAVHGHRSPRAGSSVWPSCSRSTDDAATDARHRAGDVERQPGAALGVPPGLDVLPRLHARAEPGADAVARAARDSSGGRCCTDGPPTTCSWPSSPTGSGRRACAIAGAEW